MARMGTWGTWLSGALASEANLSLHINICLLLSFCVMQCSSRFEMRRITSGNGGIRHRFSWLALFLRSRHSRLKHSFFKMRAQSRPWTRPGQPIQPTRDTTPPSPNDLAITTTSTGEPPFVAPRTAGSLLLRHSTHHGDGHGATIEARSRVWLIHSTWQ